MTDLYRSEALQRMRSPEQLDAMLRLTHPRAWMLLGILGALILLATAWGLFGQIPIRVNGMGVITLADVNTYRLQAQAAGSVRSVAVNAGDRVAAGATIATLALPVDEAELVSAQAALRLAQEQYATQSKFLQEDTNLRRKTTAELEKTLQSVIADSEQQLNFLQDLLNTQTAALKKGYYTRQQVESTRSSLFSTTQAIAKARDQIAQNRLSLSEAENQNRQQDLSLRTAVEQAEAPVKRLLATLGSEQIVTSPVAGVVTELDLAPGAMVEVGQLVAVVEQWGETLNAVGYFAVGQGKQIQTGMEAEVSPLSVERDRYGSLLARVEAVSLLPVTEDALVARLGNQTLAQTLLQGGAPISVTLSLIKDEKTQSGLQWTSSQGPPVTITPGDTAAVSVVVREQRPIEFVIPLFAAWTRPS
ncbi:MULTISPECIES: NHLP bacteriocin system secretion protein [Thiorhodovibrio]|uniref:NHLP bacteriocin system secretion protein n=1 Tax=Thiorhodovibrio TaxID=61593 RepID=UPI0019119CAF|nr:MULTISPECIES: NHLP bacteriocin system secretion protein [Thiorhodovibrio]MBK5969999.1 NHLP bacteriocin system secretion protein [Thiorhodovibrio winogradskyi]WPL12921.1 putative efflux pump membrane fusion protein [Thiorhodovibrio litoralis]